MSKLLARIHIRLHALAVAFLIALPVLLDKTSTRSDTEIPARININTAPALVVQALPGLTDVELRSILEHRPNPLSGQALEAIFQTPASTIRTRRHKRGSTAPRRRRWRRAERYDA